MSVKQVAQQLVAALPDDATFQDLDEFLWERSEVERGRDDLASGQVSSHAEVTGSQEPGMEGVLWSGHAAESLRAAVEEEERAALLSAVHEACRSLVAGEGSAISLPEMGDAGILEIAVRLARRRFRLLHERKGASIRMLWFTDNTTCYRNIRYFVGTRA